MGTGSWRKHKVKYIVIAIMAQVPLLSSADISNMRLTKNPIPRGTKRNESYQTNVCNRTTCEMHKLLFEVNAKRELMFNQIQTH